jgi:leader peptidase (prepilin peptidase)/N-methyltransferase
MALEVVFLAVPVALAALCAWGAARGWGGEGWERLSSGPVLSGALGALNGALVGGFIVWLFRVGGSLAFGREAMGLGDVHLMLGIGAALGPGAAAAVFFLAPVFGLGVALFQFFGSGRRELPYGPYLSLAAFAVMLFYRPIFEALSPGVESLGWLIGRMLGVGE